MEMLKATQDLPIERLGVSSRGLQLISAQETRLNELRLRHINTSLAQQSYDALVGCVIALASLETAAMATQVFRGLPTLRQRLPRSGAH